MAAPTNKVYSAEEFELQALKSLIGTCDTEDEIANAAQYLAKVTTEYDRQRRRRNFTEIMGDAVKELHAREVAFQEVRLYDVIRKSSAFFLRGRQKPSPGLLLAINRCISVWMSCTMHGMIAGKTGGTPAEMFLDLMDHHITDEDHTAWMMNDIAYLHNFLKSLDEFLKQKKKRKDKADELLTAKRQRTEQYVNENEYDCSVPDEDTANAKDMAEQSFSTISDTTMQEESVHLQSTSVNNLFFISSQPLRGEDSIISSPSPNDLRLVKIKKEPEEPASIVGGIAPRRIAKAKSSTTARGEFHVNKTVRGKVSDIKAQYSQSCRALLDAEVDMNQDSQNADIALNRFRDSVIDVRESIISKLAFFDGTLGKQLDEELCTVEDAEAILDEVVRKAMGLKVIFRDEHRENIDVKKTAKLRLEAARETHEALKEKKDKIDQAAKAIQALNDL